MKKSDLAMIILIASVSVLVAFFVAKAVFGDVYNGTATVKTVDAIDASLAELSTDVFNEAAINPTVKVEVSDTK